MQQLSNQPHCFSQFTCHTTAREIIIKCKLTKLFPYLKSFTGSLKAVASKLLSTAHRALHDRTHPHVSSITPYNSPFGLYTAGEQNAWCFSRYAMPLHLLFPWPRMPFPTFSPGEFPLILHSLMMWFSFANLSSYPLPATVSPLVCVLPVFCAYSHYNLYHVLLISCPVSVSSTWSRFP